MKILVCIKPDVSGKEIGPFESLALEAGLNIKESGLGAGTDSSRVDVITAGPPEWREIIGRAFGMGADRGVHVLTESDPSGLVPASVTAELLVGAVAGLEEKSQYDLILFGVMSQDLMAGQTGPMVAEHLGRPVITAGVRIESMDTRLEVQREWEGGVRETLDMPFPCVVTIQPGFFKPRYPRLSNMLKAKDKPIVKLIPRDIPKPKESFLETVLPQKTRAGRIISGSSKDQVQAFNEFLRERALL